VNRPLSLAYDELLRLPAVERFQTLECISNKVGGDLISTAKWVGIPLPMILERAGVRSSAAVEVVFRAAAGYSDSLTIEQAMDESTLVAVGMNDHVLPREHGFPARLLSVGTYGMKNPKWLERIDVVARPYTGYWEDRGWSKRAIVKTGSRIDVPHRGDVASKPVTVAGLAFAGDREISRVEVSTDGGSTWQPAELKRPLSPYAWRLWKYRWTPPAGSGRSLIRVRAYDGRGVVQSAVPALPHPDGASGYDGTAITRAAGTG
jgi:DMSO/TMAO reductase YedYZ molybdopterin-dependent catalytic subunit